MILNAFLEAVERIVGKENILSDINSLTLAETTNYQTNERIQAIILPADKNELQLCIVAANEHNVHVYPVSKGKNWGYGSRVPITDNSVIIDLSRLNNIYELNEELGYVTLEPGVTFGQLYDFLRERNSDLIISTTGGGTDSSVLANAMERGIGTGLYAERFAHICGLEVLLPDGNIISTGMARFGDNEAGSIYKWGMGPSLDGIFSQSNYGIITKATLWLMKCPAYMKLLFYRVDDTEKLALLMNVVRELAMDGVVRPAITVYNDFRTISTVVQYPWDNCNPATSTVDDVMAAIKQKMPTLGFIGKWNGEISIRAVSKEHLDIQAKIIENALQAYSAEIIGVEITKEQIQEKHSLHYRQKDVPHEENIIKSFLVRKYIGVPDNAPVRQPYWRKKTPIPVDMDPDRDKCGLVWICPIVAFRGSDILKAISIIEKITSAHSFEPAISLQCLTERAVNVIASIAWDREVIGEDEKATLCYKEMYQALNENGYYAYRNTTLGMHDNVSSLSDAYSQLLNKIKKAVDPQNILAVGRYNITG